MVLGVPGRSLAELRALPIAHCHLGCLLGVFLAVLRPLPIAHCLCGGLLGAFLFHSCLPPEPTRSDGEAEDDGGGDLEAAVEGAEAGGFGFGADEFLAGQLRAVGGVALGELAERDAEQAGDDFEQAELEPGVIGSARWRSYPRGARCSAARCSR